MPLQASEEGVLRTEPRRGLGGVSGTSHGALSRAMAATSVPSILVKPLADTVRA